MALIDLHVHSNISDGTLDPRELVRYAVSHNVSVFALTDHDSVNGIEPALAEAEALRKKGTEIRCIPGIEISAAYRDRDIHILGLMIDHNNTALNKLVATAEAERDIRNEKMVGLFRQSGIPITVEELRAGRSDISLTRAHYASYLIKHGYVKSTAEAFDKYLGYSCPFYVKRGYINPKHAIDTIISAGGLPILAHPLLYKLKLSELEMLIRELKTYGLCGLEVYYSSNVNNDEDTVHHLADKFGLIATGGSDFHGANKPQLEIGCGRGNLQVPAKVLDELQELKKNNGLYP